MASGENKVVVLEDDKTLAAALKSLLARDGVETMVTASPEEARDYLNQHRVTTLFVDCLLPSENGVDFARNIRSQFPKEILDIVLMSGIFTEAGFIRDSIRETGALGFLRKPFTNEEVLKFVKRNSVTEEAPHPRKLLYRLFSRPDASSREKRKAIEALEDIHGFDLPLIYSVLVDAKLSGHLNIVAEGGDVSGIVFSEGVITGVDIADKETYLGKLLIESGYIRPEDLNEVLNIRNTKKIGDKLIQANLLSPHGFNIVLSNQMSLRLSRTIVNENVRINFVPSEVEKTEPHIDSELFQTFLHDWIASKLTLEWLKANFTQWASARFVRSPLYGQRVSALRLPLVVNLEGVVEKLVSGLTLAEVLDSKTFNEETLYKTLHFLLTRGLLSCEDRPILKAEERVAIMRKMLQQFTQKNRVEVFDLLVRMTNQSAENPDRVYKEYLDLLGSEPDPADKELSVLYHQLMQISKGAYDFARSGNREKMKEELLKGEVELRLKAASLFEEGKNCLQRSQFREALDFIQKAAGMDPRIDKLHLHLAWAKLGNIDQSKTKNQTLKDVDLELMQVSPEDKFDALYSFVMGLSQKAKGDYPSARKSFEKAIALDNTMIVARREITVLASLEPAKTDLFNDDLTSLVGNFFSRKKK